MQATLTDSQTAIEKERESWENEGGRAEPFAVAGTTPAVESQPFPAVIVGDLVLQDLELQHLVDGHALGRYRVQQGGLGEGGVVFLVTLYGATCSKVEMLIRRKLAWRDYVAAMKHAIEREVGYWQNRGLPLSRDAKRTLEIKVRDTDFVVS